MIQITKVTQPTEGAIVVARCPLCKVTHIGSNWRLVKPEDGDYWLLAGCPLSAHRDVPLNCEVASAQPDPALHVDSITDLPPNGYAIADNGEDVNVWMVKGAAGHYVEEPREPRVDEFAIVTEDAERVLPSQWRSS